MPDDVVACTIQLICEAKSEQHYAVGELWKQLSTTSLDVQPLLQVATWCIGEYGDLLVNGMKYFICINLYSNEVASCMFYLYNNIIN